VKHIGTWFAFAQKLGLGIEEMEDITLVTGCDRTRSWTNVTFLGGQADAQVSFGVKVEGAGTSINFQLSPELVRGAVISQGPEGTVRFVCPLKHSTNSREFGTPLEPA
jgi:hypothetical protein